MPPRIYIRRAVYERLIEEARRAPRRECCGFLAGRDGVITAILPATNALASATAFEVAPVELFRLVRQMRAQMLEHLGIYHSHVIGDNVPSPRDIERAFYPDVAYFILSSRPDATQAVRAFMIRDGEVKEIGIEVEDESKRGDLSP